MVIINSIVCPEKFDQSSIQKPVPYHWVNNLLCRNDSCIYCLCQAIKSFKGNNQAIEHTFADQKFWSWSQMLQQAAYKWQPLEHVAYCRPTHFHLSMSPTKQWSWNTGLLLRIENLKNFSSYVSTHSAPIYQCYAPLHPKLGYSGADPVIKFPKKMG